MKFLSEMEWNTKWDWDNLVSFHSKASESLKMLQLTDWGIEDEGEIDAGSFDLSGIGGSSGGSGSDLGNGSSVKSSKSASTDSSPKEGTAKTSSFAFEALESSASVTVKKSVPVSADLSRTSTLEPSGATVEPVIGLKLGKRTYFENSSGNGSSIKSPAITVVPVASVTAMKKSKLPSQNGVAPRCQVEGCNLDLSSAKDYHRKHRVCDSHSKCPKVTVKGLERRFCQQCSRFHSLTEFDEKKRSCRRRLSDHNTRRRKPRQETIQFNSTKLSASFYDCRQNMNFSLSNVGSAGNPTWENMGGSKFTITKRSSLKPEKVGLPTFSGVGLPYAIPVHGNSSNELLTSKGNAANVFKQELKESIFSSNLDAAPELPRALSLLSTNSWGSSEAECISFDQPLQANHSNPGSGIPLSVIPQSLQYEYWQQMEQQSNGSLANSFASGNSNSGGQFPGIQLLKPQYHQHQHHHHGIY